MGGYNFKLRILTLLIPSLILCQCDSKTQLHYLNEEFSYGDCTLTLTDFEIQQLESSSEYLFVAQYNIKGLDKSSSFSKYSFILKDANINKSVNSSDKEENDFCSSFEYNYNYNGFNLIADSYESNFIRKDDYSFSYKVCFHVTNNSKSNDIYNREYVIKHSFPMVSMIKQEDVVSKYCYK